MARASRQMLSASAGSLSSRYRSALAMARATVSGERVLSSNSMRTSGLRAKHAQELHNRVVQTVDDALFQRDDRVVGNRDALRADLRAAFRDVAIADAMRILELPGAIARVEGMHLESGGVHEMPRADELLEHLMFAQHVTDILAEKTLDALAELLHALDVGLEDAPRTVRRVRRTRRKRLDGQLCAKIPRHIRHEIPDCRKGTHGLDGDRLGKVELVQASHAHQP